MAGCSMYRHDSQAMPAVTSVATKIEPIGPSQLVPSAASTCCTGKAQM
ncbi:hypothetical protein ACFPRL_23695 [Pseudoclavibacter helvolus]